MTWRVEKGRLERGLLGQAEAMRRRGDWVPIDQLPAHLPAAFLAVVDTSSFTRRGTEPQRGPALSSDLVRQVHRLDETASGSSRELILAPLLERSLDRQGLLELYLNRIYMGSSGEWR